MKKILTILCLVVAQLAHAQGGNIRAMFYNLYRFPDNPPAKREFILKEIFNDYRPDLFMTCELIREEGADRILNNALQTENFNYARAVFTPTTVYLDEPLQQMVFYNQDKLTLIHQEVLPTRVREINHYTFILNTIDIATDSVWLDVFVTHLKASDGPDNVAARLKMIDTFVKALSFIPPSHHVLLAGDFNFYSAYTEPAYQKIIDPSNPIVMLDPIDRPGNWSDNDTFKAIHTQATRTSADGFGVGGATGGLDDRFDFIMMSENLKQSPDLSYVPGSYKAFGNNGNCFNKRIDDYECEGMYSLELRKRLHNMSDHLPVVMQLQTGKKFLTIKEQPGQPIISLPEGNIAGEQLNVKVNPDRLPKGAAIAVYNNLGQRIYSLSYNGKTANLLLPTGGMTSGLYYLRIGTGECVF
jgi:endonuclease/exonuclease/phosphatase family metal-dependent hydrolase